MSTNVKPLRVPACTNCARRKTKCDRKSPCANCRGSKSQCRYAEKPTEKKRRVLHSTRYEESLTDIRHQIETLSSTLQSVVNNDQQDRLVSRRDEQNSSRAYASVSLEPMRNADITNAHDQQDFEGETSFYAQSRSIADTLNLAAVATLSDTTSPQAPAMDAVRSLIHDASNSDLLAVEKSSSRPSMSMYSHYPELADLSLPPMDAVLRILAFAKTTLQRFFMLPHVDQDEFAELCQKLYFPTQPFTIFAWINVNCGLFYLFQDLNQKSRSQLLMTKAQVSNIRFTCYNNIHQAATSLRLCCDSSFEAVVALVSAGAIHLECAKGPLAWRLTFAAARMTIDLGYHRLPSGFGDRERSRRRKLFWYVYSMDKSMAFNFGRSSTIQDYDVTTDRPLPSQDFHDQWGGVSNAYIEFTKIQYSVYEQLFSASAQREPLASRIARVHEIANKLAKVRQDFVEVVDLKDVIFRGTDVSLSSVLTLIYRILPPLHQVDSQVSELDGREPLQFHSLCVEAGRDALQKLANGWTELADTVDMDTANLFINWTLHHVPFMPFLAVFGHQIATGNQEELLLMRSVVKIVEKALEANDALQKTHHAFTRFLKIAELWMSTRNHGHERSRSHAHVLPVPVSDQCSDPCAEMVQQPQSSLQGLTADTEHAGLSGPDFGSLNWQDLAMTDQDWNAVFNEFDFGLGAESAREMMPWFEQRFADQNMFD